MKKRYLLALSFLLFILILWIQWVRMSQGLARWIKEIQQPDYVLLYSSESKGRYTAIFDTGNCELAVCDWDSSNQLKSSKLSFLSESGEEVHDRDRKFQILVGPGVQLGTLRVYTPRPHGIAWPIRPEFSGKIRVTKEARNGLDSSNTARTELDVVVSWHEK